MKKIFKILFLLFFILLSCELIFAQKMVKCRWCKNGSVTYTEYISCKNCETWADSYRNIKGCHVCKNNKVISKIKQTKCIFCKGVGWVKKEPPAPITKEQKAYTKIRELKLKPTYHIGYFRLNYNYSMNDVMKYRVSYEYSDGNLWYLLYRITHNELKYTEVKDKVDALLDYYELILYPESSKSDGWPDGGCNTFYPSPSEANSIRNQLKYYYDRGENPIILFMEGTFY